MRHITLPNHLYVWADNTFLTGGKITGRTPAVLHGIYGRPGQVILTHLLLETGAHWSGVPIHGIYHKETSAGAKLQKCQAWGNMGENIEAFSLPYLEGLQIERLSDGEKGHSTGMCIDWTDGFTHHPTMHKTLHLLLMDDGTLSLQPNNGLKWSDPSFVDHSKWEEARHYRRGDQVWYPEWETK